MIPIHLPDRSGGVEPDWDVLVVGRSYAGLSAALNLARARRSVLAVGAGGPRNEAVHHVHGLITRDGATPGDLVALAEQDVLRYPTVELVEGRVLEIAAVPGGFAASVGGRPTTARAVVLATGVNDDPPPIPGLAEHWGRGVFTCPFCDGFEHQDAHLAVIGSPAFVPHLARLLTGWTSRVTVFHDELVDEERAGLVASGVSVDPRPIRRVRGDGAAVAGLELEDGSVVDIGAVFVAQLPTPNHALAVALGCEVDDLGHVVVDAARRTSVPGVWATGDLTSLRASVSVAIADGVIAGSDCAASLITAALADAPLPIS